MRVRCLLHSVLRGGVTDVTAKDIKLLCIYACAHARESAIVGLFHQVWIAPCFFFIFSCTQRREFEVLDLFSLKSRTFSLKSA